MHLLMRELLKLFRQRESSLMLKPESFVLLAIVDYALLTNLSQVVLNFKNKLILKESIVILIKMLQEYQSNDVNNFNKSFMSVDGGRLT